jgi:hypothetical protein
MQKHLTPALLTAVLAALVLFAGPVTAQNTGKTNVLIQGGHSGTWYDVYQPGHGLFLEVLNDPSSPTGKEVLVAWFAYFDGSQVWLIGQGDVAPLGNGFHAVIDVSIFEGNDFPPRYDPDRTEGSDWGQLDLAFTGCDQATLHWESVVPGYGEGDLNLRRLSQIADSKCIPDLGGEDKADDHGDTWATGTYLTSVDSQVRAIEGELEQSGDVDVFVFSLGQSRTFTAYTLGPTDTDTVGTLYKLVAYEEEEVATDDDGSHFGGFKIVEQLSAGTYSLHVAGKGHAERGPYVLYYKAAGN